MPSLAIVRAFQGGPEDATLARLCARRLTIVARDRVPRVFLAQVRLDVAVEKVAFDDGPVGVHQLDANAVVLNVVLAQDVIARTGRRLPRFLRRERANAMVLVRRDPHPRTVAREHVALDRPAVARLVGGKERGQGRRGPGPDQDAVPVPPEAVAAHDEAVAVLHRDARLA